MTMASQMPLAQGKLIGQGRTAEVYAWIDDRVLKLYRAGWDIAWAEREARITQVVAAAGLPVPAVHGVIEVGGRFGILLGRMVGPSMVQQCGVRPWTLGRMLRTFTDLHLAMHAHSMAFSDLPSQRTLLARQIESVSAVPDRVREAALRRLDQLPDGSALCHGDFHPDNVLLTRNGPIIIDWGSARRGHPLADVAQTALLLRVGELPSSERTRWLIASARAFVRRNYIRRYLRRRPARAEEFAAWCLPIAVARLGEGIVEERSKLLRLIEMEATCP